MSGRGAEDRDTGRGGVDGDRQRSGLGALVASCVERAGCDVVRAGRQRGGGVVEGPSAAAIHGRCSDRDAIEEDFDLDVRLCCAVEEESLVVG